MPTQSKQPRLSQTQDVNTATAYLWSVFERYNDDVPKWSLNAGQRTLKLREMARAEPILAGAVASMTSKITSLNWTITGGRNSVRRYQDMLANAEDGRGWAFWSSRFVQDVLWSDMGGSAELARQGLLGPVAGVYNLDAALLRLTGNMDYPMVYQSAVGDKGAGEVRFSGLDYMSLVDMPSPDERMMGMGFCSVSRALKAARVLLSLYRYEEEQLSDLPPQGLVAVTGMSMPELKNAFALYDSMRKDKEQVTFKGVLWLAVQQFAPMGQQQNIDVKLVPFSTLPAHFTMREAVERYVATLALDFGTDVREFWPWSSGQLGSGNEVRVQADKAKGKAFGTLTSGIERTINWNILPQGSEFSFDQKNAEDALISASVDEKVINNIVKLTTPLLGSGSNPFAGPVPPQLQGFTGQSGNPFGQQQDQQTPDQQPLPFEQAPQDAGPTDSFGNPLKAIISPQEARKILVERGVLPDWLGVSDETTLEGISQKAARAPLGPGEDFVRIDRSGNVERLWPPRTYVYGWTAPGSAMIAAQEQQALSSLFQGKNEPPIEW
jgi:hypothetical protein